MADDPKKRHSPDRDRINMNQDHEVRYWTKELAVTEDELRQAVAAVGNQAKAVRQHLNK